MKISRYTVVVQNLPNVVAGVIINFPAPGDSTEGFLTTLTLDKARSGAGALPEEGVAFKRFLVTFCKSSFPLSSDFTLTLFTPLEGLEVEDICSNQKMTFLSTLRHVASLL